MKPEEFELISDYASIGNDASAVLSVTVPSSVAIAGNGFVTYTNVVSVGVQGAVEIGSITSSKLSKDFPAPILSVERNGSAGPYTVRVWIGRTSATEVTLSAGIWNPNNFAMTGESGAETFTVRISTFIPPFNL